MEAMTGSEDKDRKALERLNDALVEDILDMSDEDVLAEAKQDGTDPEAVAAAMAALFAKTVTAKRKARLAAAKAAVAADRGRPAAIAVPSDPAEARRLLERLLARYPDTAGKLTMAARKGKAGALSDDEVFGLLEDFQGVGISLSEESGEET
jgi:hypothetical protein